MLSANAKWPFVSSVLAFLVLACNLGEKSAVF